MDRSLDFHKHSSVEGEEPEEAEVDGESLPSVRDLLK